MVDYFETYIYTAGALAIVVLTIEVCSVFSHLIKYKIICHFLFHDAAEVICVTLLMKGQSVIINEKFVSLHG